MRAPRLDACSLPLVGLAAGLLSYAISTPAVWAAAPEPTPEQVKFFEERVRPILAENCYKCHGSEHQKGKLRLDLREMALSGGESGTVIVPGHPERSLLVEAVKWESLEMPPTGKLSDQQIATLAEWIKLGAPMPKDHGAAGIELRKNRGVITDEDRQWWAFQPIRKATPPAAADDRWSRGPIDAFLLAPLASEGLAPAPEADRQTLIRRLSWDLVGLPPSADAVESFVADERPDAYERLADRLLTSPHHGERWARHWLDLVRYAESDGYKQDAYRPEAWRYRDYVIRSLNADKPYSQFVLEQLAGDEAAPHDPDALLATGYLRLGIYEYNQRDVRGHWANILNDLTDVTADVFLGLGLSCARCHDHKFDPILQKDYYRLQAFFAPILWRENVPAASPEEVAEYQRQLAIWEARTADIRRQIAEIEDPIRASASQVTLVKFTDDLQELMAKPPAERTPYEAQLVYLCLFQATDGEGKADVAAKLKGEKKERWEGLKKQLAEHDAARPRPIPLIPTVTDVGPIAPEVSIPGRKSAEPIDPGPPSVLDPGPLEIPASPSSLTTGRRTALARWIAAEDNPLPSRVLANRLWQYHFGRGLCESPSDFGRLGQPPSHPELLDYLASDLLTNNWSLKRLHRRIVTSAAYRQVSHGPAVAASAAKDPLNRLFARMSVRRLSAEQIRDAAIAATGELDPRVGGEGGDWGKSARRAIYLKVLRNKQDATLDVFDVPDGQSSAPVRNVTTTPTQSLYMINGPWMMVRAKELARRLGDSSSTLDQRVTAAYRAAFSREPTAGELRSALEFLQSSDANDDQALTDFCHVLLNANEFLYVD
ncbi:MAG: PSD1 and planctomycete cytochrome C domain-containing protein [Planctomycetaceae bacterium]|nr:PSD1 and planctomycete cytochrome C domain-containing protein [Planctomycetaceae bacterium]